MICNIDPYNEEVDGVYCATHNVWNGPATRYQCLSPAAKAKLSHPATTFKPSRPSSDAGWLLVAEAVAARADCRRRQIGAVIVDKDDRIVSTGRNGGPPKGPSCLAGECPRGLITYDDLPPDSSYDSGIGLCIAVHAEANAIIFGDPGRMRGGTIYISCPVPPCLGCQRLIDGMGLKVIFNTLKENHEHR